MHTCVDVRVCVHNHGTYILMHAYDSWGRSSAGRFLAACVAGEGVALGAGLGFEWGVLVRANGTGWFEAEASWSQKPGSGADPSSIMSPGNFPPISVTSILLIVVSADDRRSLPDVLVPVQYSRISGSYLSFLGTKSKPSHN